MHSSGDMANQYSEQRKFYRRASSEIALSAARARKPERDSRPLVCWSIIQQG
jgi:hypothetical protein